MISDDVVITVLDVRGDVVRLGIKAPRSVQVHREEVYRELQLANREAASPSDVAVQALTELLSPPTAESAQPTEALTEAQPARRVDPDPAATTDRPGYGGPGTSVPGPPASRPWGRRQRGDSSVRDRTAPQVTGPRDAEHVHPRRLEVPGVASSLPRRVPRPAAVRDGRTVAVGRQGQVNCAISAPRTVDRARRGVALGPDGCTRRPAAPGRRRPYRLRPDVAARAPRRACAPRRPG
jgi:carbon storage regulator